HSMNYRSVVVFGTAMPVASSEEKLRALRALSDHLVKGRWQEVRSPAASELKGTLVLSLPIDEASAKVRTGPPVDDEDDYGLLVWAGVLPLKIMAAEPVPDRDFRKTLPLPLTSLAIQALGPRFELNLL